MLTNIIALGAGAVDPAGTSVLTDAVKTAITSGFNNLAATVSDVLLIAVPVCIGIIALSAGIHFALSKVRSTVSWAS